MQTSEQGIKMITAFEGIEEKAYKCPSGVWTIGVGHTGKVDGSPINAGMHITQEKAMQLLRQDLAHFEEYINAEPYAKKLQQHQFDALVSFIFNVGPPPCAGNCAQEPTKIPSPQNSADGSTAMPTEGKTNCQVLCVAEK